MTAGKATDFNPAVRSVAERVSLNGQVALVTGGSRGIGRAMSAAIGKAGASVCVFARNPGRLAETKRELEELEVPVVSIAGDVSNPADVSAAVDQVTAELGPIDLLINNAGVQTSIGDCAVVDQEAWWDDVTVNLYGPMLFMRRVLPTMISRRRGRVINVSSNASWLPFPHVSSYTAAKAALVRLTETVALETREQGVSLFSISPGTVKTELMDYTVHQLNNRNEFDNVLGKISMDFISPAFAADLVLALAGGEADVLTGRYLAVHDDLPEQIRTVSADPSVELGHLRIARP